MISEKENQRLTRVGPGTPGGELMRRYWHPIAVTSELERNATKRVRLLGEDLVLYRDRSGNLGLLEPQCAHRRVDLFYGIPAIPSYPFRGSAYVIWDSGPGLVAPPPVGDDQSFSPSQPFPWRPPSACSKCSKTKERWNS